MNDSSLFADSLIKLRDGTQGAYKNCTKPGDNTSHVQLLSFYADGRNSFSKLLREYYELALSMGADGIFHDEFPASNYRYTYHSPWCGGERAVRLLTIYSIMFVLGLSWQITH